MFNFAIKKNRKRIETYDLKSHIPLIPNRSYPLHALGEPGLGSCIPYLFTLLKEADPRESRGCVSAFVLRRSVSGTEEGIPLARE